MTLGTDLKHGKPSLSFRMRHAADVLDEASTKLGYPENSLWAPEVLRQRAEEMAREEAELEAVIGELAREMHAANHKYHGSNTPPSDFQNVRDIYIAVARDLVESGWRQTGGRA